MKVTFESKSLLGAYETSRLAAKRWGDKIGRKYIERVNILRAATDLSDLRRIPPLHLHKLSGRREGQYAVNLDRRYRLAFTYDQANNAVRVKEVSLHYGD